jgi:hypothetical protein
MYPYLGLSLFLFFIALILMIAFPKRRRLMLFSGLFSLPFSLFSVAFVPEYWNPVRWGGSIVGIEDILFSFSTGCIVWLFACLISRQHFGFNADFKNIMKRYLLVVNGGIFCGILLWVSGMLVMTATIILISAVGLVLWYCYKKWWFFLLSGALGFTLFYVLVMAAVFVVWPHFVFQWSFENLSGLSVFGIPCEEVIWAFVFGAVWPVFFVFITDSKNTDTGS